MNKLLAITFIALISLITSVNAQSVLESNNFKIIDPTIDSGGGVSEGSGNFNLLSSAGGSVSDSRLESNSYALGVGFPNGIQANVPLVRCAETSTDSITTECLNFFNSNGANGECGYPGCYDRAKIEIDHQSNPVDTLFLVSVFDKTNSIQYYLTTAHSLSTNTPTLANNYMTICEIEGKDIRSGSGCATDIDAGWNEDLQKYNIYGLTPATEYEIRVRAMSGNFTETQYSPLKSFTTELPTLAFDIDIAGVGGFATETTGPHRINLGEISDIAATTATDRIWLDMNTNAMGGMQLFVRDQNDGLLSGSNLIPSQTEDLAVDSGADGGFGLKIETATQTSVGPLQRTVLYNTSTTDEVGAVSTSNAQVFFTNNIDANMGPLQGGRASISVKARKTAGTPAGVYTDILTFTMTANL